MRIKKEEDLRGTHVCERRMKVQREHRPTNREVANYNGWCRLILWMMRRDTRHKGLNGARAFNLWCFVGGGEGGGGGGC